MSPKLEKIISPSKFILYLTVISIFLFILYSTFLTHFGKNSYIPRSILELVVVNNTSLYFSPSTGSEEAVCQNSNPSKDYGPLVQHGSKASDPNQALLRVYMYDLPPEFHFGLMGWRGNANETWPDISNPNQILPYPGGLNLQHSVEYWLTLDLLSSNSRNIARPCTAVLVTNSSEADVIFVPFFASLSFNRHSKSSGKDKVSVNRMLQDKLVEFLEDQDEWKRLGGKDHLIIAHHPNSMLMARRKLASAMFVLADFGRYPVEIANLEKDIIAPYKYIVTAVADSISAPFEARPILAYFQGEIFRKDGGEIRQELYYLLKDEKDVHFTFGSTRANGFREAGQGMASSKFCLNIAGDTPSSNRLFDAIASHCVPVIISDEIELPFEAVLDYSEFCIFVHGSDAVKKGYLINRLRRINRNKWTKMSERLKEIAVHFEYQYPSKTGDAVEMIWHEVARKMPSIKLEAHRRKRYPNLSSRWRLNDTRNQLGI